MRALAHPLPIQLETSVKPPASKSLMTPLISAIILATGGATDAVATIATGKGILAETGLPTEYQLGFSVVFLAGLCYCAKRLEVIHKERIDEWKQRYETERKEKQDLIKRLREIQDAKDKRLEFLEGDDGR